MDLKRITSSLLFKIVVAIILGIACSFFFPVWLARVFATFNGPVSYTHLTLPTICSV